MLYGTTAPFIGSSSQLGSDVVVLSKIHYALSDTKARVFRSGSDQAISATTETKVQFNGETFDPQARFDAVTNYRFQVSSTYAGYYLVAAQLSLTAPASSSFYQVSIYKNGAKICLAQSLVPTGLGQPSINIVDYISLTTTDYIEIYVYLGVAASVVNGTDRSWAYFARLF